MNICSKPATTKQLVCHNGKDIYHYVENTPNLVTVSGQPYMIAKDTKLELYNAVKAKKMSVENKLDLAEYKVVLDKEISDKIIADKEVLDKTIADKIIVEI